jgi:hypothetical protein
MNQRGITRAMLDAAEIYGEKIYALNTLYFFLGKRAIQELTRLIQLDNPEKWEGITVAINPKTLEVITCFKNKQWLKKIRHKN